MSKSHGQFIWCELLCDDTPAATAFYKVVVGWGACPSGLTDRDYTILSAGETPVAGLMELPAEARAGGARPGWIGYIGVDDVDAYVERVVAAGGSLHRASEDIPGVGRFALVADPQGAVFTLFKPFGDQPYSPAPGGTPGHVGWHELLATDGGKAFAFYADLFGWTKAAAIDMGPMGIYQCFATGGEAVGGMMSKPTAVPVPYWGFYFNVSEIEPAVARIKDAGGQIVNGPQQVPGGSWIVQAIDPQGAMFAVVGPGQ